MLRFGEELLLTLFPESTVRVEKNGKVSRWPTDSVIDFKYEKIISWTHRILDEAVNISKGKEYELPFDTPVLPLAIGEILLDSCLKLQTNGRDLTDLDYYFIGEIGTAVRMDNREVYARIEQTLYEVRKSIFGHLKPILSERQKSICAALLLKAIRADKVVHPAELKYFEIISDLLENNQAEIEQIEANTDKIEGDLSSAFPDDIAEFLFKYMVEIVMCDKHFDPDESQFIKDMGQSFNLDHQRQDEILQPIVAALMVKSDLFG